jgi:hypothetical protein
MMMHQLLRLVRDRRELDDHRMQEGSEVPDGPESGSGRVVAPWLMSGAFRTPLCVLVRLAGRKYLLNVHIVTR